jgi:hypothetical protein
VEKSLEKNQLSIAKKAEIRKMPVKEFLRNGYLCTNENQDLKEE